MTLSRETISTCLPAVWEGEAFGPETENGCALAT